MKSQIRWGTFFKLSLVVVSSIVLTNFCTIASSDWITKNLFIQSSTFLNAKLMDNIKKKVEENNNSYLMLGLEELLSRRRRLLHGEIY